MHARSPVIVSTHILILEAHMERLLHNKWRGIRQFSINTLSVNKMATEGPQTATHKVFNQANPLEGFSLFENDPGLQRSLVASNANCARSLEALQKFGAKSGSKEMMNLADRAEKNLPALKQFDRNGRRQDVIEYDPSYHLLMTHSIEAGCTNWGYQEENKNDKSHVTRASLMYMANQLEPGHCCPVVMTSAAIPILGSVPGYEDWHAKLLQPVYDGENKPISDKAGVTLGMSMTEKQGGSDVRANTTRALPMDSRDVGNAARYELWGHKWFTSAPMGDGFLTLAVVDGGSAPSCFLVPRWLPDGSRNDGFQVMQLKNKLADRANASSEVEYRGAYATMVGDEGRGVRHIIEMVTSTRLDCALGSAGTSRRAMQHALFHASQRRAFGAALIEQPLMRSLLTDVAIECEGHTSAVMRMAELWSVRLSKGGDMDAQTAGALRVGIAIAKYYITKRAPGLVYECMEALGGNGFVEDFPVAKLFRQSPLNSIWEGSGNVICLDILRAADALPHFLGYLRRLVAEGPMAGDGDAMDVAGGELMAFFDALERDVLAVCRDPGARRSQAGARLLADRLGIALVASALVYDGSPAAASYIATRVVGQRGMGYNYGSCAFDEDVCTKILEENLPRVDV